MSIEKDLATLAANTGRIADAIEKLLGSTALTATGATGSAVEQPEPEQVKTPTSTGSKRQAKNVEREEKKPEPEPEPEVEERDPLDDDLDQEPEATFTPDEVRAALRTYRDVEGDGAMMAVLKSFGATGMASLKESDYAAVMAKVR